MPLADLLPRQKPAPNAPTQPIPRQAQQQVKIAPREAKAPTVKSYEVGAIGYAVWDMGLRVGNFVIAWAFACICGGAVWYVTRDVMMSAAYRADMESRVVAGQAEHFSDAQVQYVSVLMDATRLLDDRIDYVPALAGCTAAFIAAAIGLRPWRRHHKERA